MIEMLVVIGIIMTLMGASIAAYSGMTRRAQQARGRELVANTATALNLLFQRRGMWPDALRNEASGGAGRLREPVARCLAQNKLMSLMYDEKAKRLAGLDRFGIISPWAQMALKRAGSGGGTSLSVSSGGTLDDHVLYYALDKDGTGIVEANVGGVALRIRANAVVWSAGMDGVLIPYPYAGGGGGSGNKGQNAASRARGRAGDDIYSWSPAQVEH